MKLVRFDAAPHHLLCAFGHQIRGGETIEMPDEHAARLAADPHANVTVTSAAKRKPVPENTEEN